MKSRVTFREAINLLFCGLVSKIYYVNYAGIGGNYYRLFEGKLQYIRTGSKFMDDDEDIDVEKEFASVSDSTLFAPTYISWK